MLETEFFINGLKVYQEDNLLKLGERIVGNYKDNVYDFIGEKIDRDAASWDYQWDIFRDLHIKSYFHYPNMEEENFKKHFALPIDIVSSKKVLDAGAGTGRNSRMMSRAGGDVYALDASKSIYYQANCCTGNIKWIRSNLNNMPFNNSYFDIILCDGVIPHVSNMQKTLSEFYRLLANDGLLLISYSEPPASFFNSHNIVKIYRLITRNLDYDIVLAFSEFLSNLYEKVQTKNTCFCKKFLFEFIPDKSSYDEWRICYTFDRLTAKNWNFYPRKIFKKYLLRAGFNIKHESNFRISFVCSKKG